MQIGKITQVMGPVVDVHFDETPLPYIQTALQVDNHGKKVVMEVMQHIGTDTVRCIMLSPSEGLQKDMPVLSTGMGIEIPVGTQNLGRLFNVLGIPLMEKKRLIQIHIGPFTGNHQNLKINLLLQKFLKQELKLSTY